MSGKQIVSIIGVVAVFSLLAWGLSVLSHTVPAPVVTTENESPILGGTPTGTDSYKYTENAPYYTVDATYPRTTPLQDAAASTKVVTTIEQSISTAIAQFKKDGDFANLTPEDIQIQGLGADRKYALGYEYTEYKGANTVSYSFLVYEDTLGAHPNSYYSTFTFDQQGNKLELSDLFTPNSSYLSVLSPLAYKAVLAQLEAKQGSAVGDDQIDTVRVGTAPSPEALQFFYIDGTTLHLLFPPYAVAAYAAGSFDVAIPLSSLSNILKPEFKQ